MEVPSSDSKDAYRYVHSCELMTNVQIKIGVLEGCIRDTTNPTKKFDQVIVEATIYCNGHVVGFPVSTSFKPPRDKITKIIQSWNEWLTLPVKYSDLSRNSFIHFCVWELDAEDNCPVIPATPIPSLFDGNNYLTFPKKLVCQASMRCFSKRGVFKSGTIDLQMTISTKSDPYLKSGQDWKFGSAGKSDDHVLHLIKQAERQKRNIIDSVTWLDQITIPTIERIKEQRKKSNKNLFLVVEMASIHCGDHHYDVVYYEPVLDNRLIFASTIHSNKSGDPELGLENLCEDMHVTMTRKTRSNDAAKKLKPNKQAKEKLEHVIKLPSSQMLTSEQKDLVWKFRFYLKHDRRALTKFLHSINWDKEKEVSEALSLLDDWSPIEAEDALELLSPTFTHPAVREYAVRRLFLTTPDQVLLYLPQLVQALKYERKSEVAKDVQNTESIPKTAITPVEKIEKNEILCGDDLASSLIKYCAGYVKLTNFLFWHLKVEEEATKKTDKAMSKIYLILREELINQLYLNKSMIKHAENLPKQETFVNDLREITKDKSQRRDIRESALRTKLSQDPRMNNLHELILPLDPTYRLLNVKADATQVFSSGMMPTKLSFLVKNEEDGIVDYTMIFKQGDDLRQDQLIIQMIRLMDTLFKRDQLDLRLTPYAVLATGVDEGFVQFVKAKPLRDIMKKYSVYKDDSIREYMKEVRPDPKADYGIEVDVIDNYVRSVAGYSVICYVLGVGDRHLDNLLLCENGCLFHVDFGYILGRDPKPMPAPMKLTTEMVTAMGGMHSKEFKKFCVYCDTAYSILRRHANVILNLFSLMLDAGIKNIAEEKDKAVFKVEQRLNLDLTDQAAFIFIMRLINESLDAKMPIIVDIIHDWNQRFNW